VHDFSTGGSALVTKRTDLGGSGTSWLYPPALLGDIRIRVTPASSGSETFVGIGPTAAVESYLAGVSHTVISDFWSGSSEAVVGGGNTPASAPGTQGFWVAKTSAAGPQSLVWHPAGGAWSVVVMNADGTPQVAVGADLGARIPALLWIAIGLLALGAVFGVGGVLLIVGAIRRRRAGASGAA
jgi:hypothetical protein